MITKQKKKIVALILTLACILTLIPQHLVSQVFATDYQVSNAAELIALAQQSQNYDFAGKTITLSADITLTGSEDLGDLDSLTFGNKEYPFRGTFDGAGYTIDGLTCKLTEADAKADTGLFAYTENATIKNLVIKNADINADYRGGILVGKAVNTHFENVSVQDSYIRLSCYNNVLTLVTDAGLCGGGLIGEAEACYLYNCETVNTTVNNNNTAGVAALGGKGLYLGGLIGTATRGTIVEYCRTLDGLVKSEYDVAVGALGGNTLYVGGIIGEMHSGSKVIDTFATNELYFYCATYVSVGAGNSGYIGGIAGAMYGESCQLQRCHYAGTASSKQYNAILVIPIIQNDVGLNGIAGKVEGGIVEDCFYKYEDNPSKMRVMDNDTDATTSCGPLDNATYLNQDYWEFHGYDFVGYADRKSEFVKYSDYINDGYSPSSQEEYHNSHLNKWVMDYTRNIPVHGSSMQATFDFPGAGTLSIDSTDLVNQKTFTTEPLEPAYQVYNTMDKSLTIEMKLNEGYRIVSWSRKDVFTSTRIPDYDYLRTIVATEEKVAESVNSITRTEYWDNDLYVAHVEARVRFFQLDGNQIGEEAWYSYQDALNTEYADSNVISSSDTATLIGWTTVTGGYEGITTAELNSIKENGQFFENGDPVEQAMDLYPVFADLISNVTVVIEGYTNSEKDSRTDGSVHVGDVKVGKDEGGIYVEFLLDANADGYRFLGWYTGCDTDTNDCSGGNRVSNTEKYYLTNYDLTQPLEFTAKMEYRVVYHPQVKDWVSEDKVLSDPFATVWHTYNQVLVEVDGFPMDGQDTFKHWGYSKWDNNDECACSADAIASGDAIKAPLDVYAHVYGSSVFDILFESDFPGSGTITHSLTGTSGVGKLTLTMSPDQGYRFIAWIGERNYNTDKWQEYFTDTTCNRNSLGTQNYKFIALMEAEVNFFNKDDSVNTTVYRRYEESVFSDVNQTHSYIYPFTGDQVSLTREDRNVSNGVHTSYPSPALVDETMKLDNYIFLGWISDAEVEKNGSDWNYIYDVVGDSYCTSDPDRAIPYLMDGTEQCYETQNIYPVYARFNIDTTTNVAIAGTPDGINIPADPQWSVEVNYDTQDGTVTLTPDLDTYISGNDGDIYTLIDFSVYKDGQLIDTIPAEKGETSYTYTVFPGPDYLFVANYRPLVLVYHTNSTQTVVESRDYGSNVGTQPVPVSIGKNYVFRGWTTEKPSGGWYHISDPEEFSLTIPSDVVTQSQELWPIYTSINISVVSNIDNLTEPNSHRYWNAEGTNAKDMTARLHADEQVTVNGVTYDFMGWYSGYGTNEQKLLTSSNEYILDTTLLFDGAVYTAEYLQVYTINYYGTDGNILESVKLLESDSRSFLEEITTEDANGNELTQTQPIDTQAFADIVTSMAPNQIFREWHWVKDNLDFVAWNQFENRSAVASMKEAGTNVMNLYPIILEATAIDSVGIVVDVTGSNPELILSFDLSSDTDEQDVLNAELNFPAKDQTGKLVEGKEWYAQPSLTVKITENTYSPGETASVGCSDITVNLFESAGVLYGSQTTDAPGKTVFYFTGQVKIEKSVTPDDNVVDTFRFIIRDTDSNEYTMLLQNREIATQELPCGHYVIVEDMSWSWAYDQDEVMVDGSVVEEGQVLITLSVGADGNHDQEISIIFANSRKDNAVWFASSDRETNHFVNQSSTKP